mmetsp:Transcript_17677/g.71371  ORF Transcript_17677/g.71371 Transcript_17677/m.71371 type:complete len:94 (-) Transcript_17677:503-784(-)
MPRSQIRHSDPQRTKFQWSLCTCQKESTNVNRLGLERAIDLEKNQTPNTTKSSKSKAVAFQKNPQKTGICIDQIQALIQGKASEGSPRSDELT